MSDIREFKGKIIPTLTHRTSSLLAEKRWGEVCLTTRCQLEYVRCTQCIFTCRCRPYGADYLAKGTADEVILDEFLSTDKSILAHTL